MNAVDHEGNPRGAIVGYYILVCIYVMCAYICAHINSHTTDSIIILYVHYNLVK